MTTGTDARIGRHRILIVDDHPIVRQGLTQMIDLQPDLLVCGEADSPAPALRLMRETGLRQRMTSAAFDLLEEKYSVEATLGRYVDHLADLLEKRNRPRVFL